jgi:predicted enzyme related to lactoylglutathione lyase
VKVPKTEAANFGWFAICTDKENNTFGLWEAKEEG